MSSLLSVVVTFSLIASVFGGQGAFDYRPMSKWPDTCAVGANQSPINIDTSNVVHPPPDAGRVEIGTMGTLSAYTVFSTGVSLEIAFDVWSIDPDVRIPANDYTIGNSTTLKPGDMLTVEPLQMHFHTFSEHSFDGFYAPGEIHIVTKVKDHASDYCDKTGGCFAVFGIMTTLEGQNERTHQTFHRLFHELPDGVGIEMGLSKTEEFNLDELLPSSLNYYTYLGSLTTPPCTEKVTWHVFTESIPVKADVIEKHQMMVSFTPGSDCAFSFLDICFPPREKTNFRPVQPLLERMVYLVEDDVN